MSLSSSFQPVRRGRHKRRQARSFFFFKADRNARACKVLPRPISSARIPPSWFRKRWRSQATPIFWYGRKILSRDGEREGEGSAPKSLSALHLFLHSAGGLKRGSADIMNSSSEVAWYFSTACENWDRRGASMSPVIRF